MKKILVLMLVVFVLFALAACGGNGDSERQGGAPSAGSDVLRFDVPFQGERWDNEPWLYITIHSDYTIVTVDSASYGINRVIDGEVVSDTTNEFIKVRVTLTNTNESRTLGIGNIRMRTPYFGSFDRAWYQVDPGDVSFVPDYSVVFRRLNEQQGDIGNTNTRGVEPGTTEERFFLFPFVGDGEYSFVVSYEREETRSASQFITATINR